MSLLAQAAKLDEAISNARNFNERNVFTLRKITVLSRMSPTDRAVQLRSDVLRARREILSK